MLNAEKYKDEVLKAIQRDCGFALTKANNVVKCYETTCTSCCFCKEDLPCNYERFKWLLEEYKEPIKTDWKKVEIDTPIILRGEIRAHFAGYDDVEDVVYYWIDGRTSFTEESTDCYAASLVKLYEEMSS